ncbi:succinate dehydrogenase, cytochrome b556 subunit [Candidatus Geothermarchaeota archaeon]|nr:MAG: succinate dehydrogenase, cytochrome b556 subunit [Candidatus Geothermarchaeota archaeon]RLG62713.1 MAG: succinate dehydrogenase, cytochrome b556 subunit [Candidatus Geothermarchaeota archaeon]HEW93185.1 succinate dehydrogenase, cytochrome b556 subunit [Thermoprotei archaeon]
MFAKRERKYKSTPNRLGVKGWYGSLKYNMEKYLYLLHRITGVGLAAFVILHVILMSSRMFGEEAYHQIHGLLMNPYTDIGMVIVTAALLFHGFNGIRLLLHEYGILFVRPKRPVYPYRVSVKSSGVRLFTILMIILAVLFFIPVLYEYIIIWW